jgi:hypothetical protein
LARLPVTFRALEKLLQGDLPEPAAARGVERVAIRAIYALSRAAVDTVVGKEAGPSTGPAINPS